MTSSIHDGVRIGRVWRKLSHLVVFHPQHGNLYSSHPFYLCVEDDGKAYGLLFWNSNAIEVTFLPSPAVSIRALGGVMDVLLIIGDSPEEVIEHYTTMIGRPYLPPYWALGFQISRYGYNTLDNMKAAYQRTVDAGIPLVTYLNHSISALTGDY